MKAEQMLGRGRIFCLALLVLMSFNLTSVLAAQGDGRGDAGLLPIENSNNNKSLIDELFEQISAGTNNGNQNNKNPDRDNNKGPKNYLEIKKSNVNGDFKCNLFESVPFEDILSAINSLNQAVSSTACSGDSSVSAQGIVDNNKTIADAVKELRGYVENSAAVQPENAANISNKVDLAIRAATTVANIFAQTDLLKKECRQSMSAGQIAISLNQVINGLTPYALMAATMTTGGAVAVPYIVGGSIITGAVGSMTKIIDENGVKVNQPEVRRAIVENTCQFIRLDQKYKFLNRPRQEQINKITADISSSQRLFKVTVNSLNGKLGFSEHLNSLNKVMVEMNMTMSAARSQLELDKQFMKSTSDDIKICQLGIQLGAMAQDKTSYVSTMLVSLDKALVAYGTSNVPQVKALKISGDLAMKNLRSVAVHQLSKNVNFKKCAETTKSFVETLDQSADLSEKLVKLGQEGVEKNLSGDKEYSLYKSSLRTLNQKKIQAQRVTDSLENLQAYANSIAQSEINAEMDRLRRGLFGNNLMGLASSPVLRWFEFVNGLHRADVARFTEGLDELRSQAFQLSPRGKDSGAFRGYYPKFTGDAKAAQNLMQFNLNDLPIGTLEHDDVCRELQDVWSRWTSAVDHLAASDAFCNMVEPYIYDNRPEDKSLVSMCRGYSRNSPKSNHGQAVLSTVAALKNSLKTDHTRDGALLIKKKILELACVDGIVLSTNQIPK
jgi:hypothetical protein